MKLFDQVRVVTELPRESKVTYGMVGFIVEDFKDGNYLIEFSKKEDGQTIAILLLNQAQIEEVT